MTNFSDDRNVFSLKASGVFNNLIRLTMASSQLQEILVLCHGLLGHLMELSHRWSFYNCDFPDLTSQTIAVKMCLQEEKNVWCSFA